MKYFFVKRYLLDDFELMKQMLKQFVYQERIPMPVRVELSREHGDCFVRDEVIVVVSSMALIKTNP